MTSLFNADFKDTERIAFLIKECKIMELSVLPPTANKSKKYFSVSGDKEIRFGLASIKNVGENIVEAIIAEREKNGEFTDLANFVERVDSKDLNKKSVESLARAGALDDLAERNSILKNIERILEYAKASHKTRTGNQTSLFSMMSDKSSVPPLRLENSAPATLAEKLAWEKELLGLYISGHPLENFENKKNKPGNTVSIASFKSKRGGPYSPSATVAALILQSRRIVTKKGESMLFLRLQDMTDEIECVVFPRTLRQFGEHIIENNCVFVSGDYSFRKDSPSIIAEEIRKM